MQFQQYQHAEFHRVYNYDFYSEGPRGRIRKIVCFASIQLVPIPIYNLTLGDWDEETNMVKYKVVSNNEDRNKVLATVADAVLKFTEENPEVSVYARGSTTSRTRLYQMLIKASLHSIKRIFYIYGFYEGVWEEFDQLKSYEGFMVKRRL